MPRQLGRMLRSAPPSSRSWDDSATETELLGLNMILRRDPPAIEVGGPAAAATTDLTIPWTSATGTHDDMLPFGVGPMVQISEPGSYDLLLQVRFAAAVPAGSTLGGSSTGKRWCYIMRGGTSALTDTVGDGWRWGVGVGLGTTVQAWATVALDVGDTLWCSYRHTSSSPITALNNDAGGTYFSIKRAGPGGST